MGNAEREAIRVLVVDDEDDFRETVVKRLKMRGLLAEGASGGCARRLLINFLRHKAVSRGRDCAGFFQFF